MGFLDTLFNKSGTSSHIKRLAPQEAKNNLEKDKNIILLDVREASEYKTGHIKGAKNLSVSIIAQAISNIAQDKDATIYVYCLSGGRSARACQVLAQMGYTKIYDLGGISSWPYEIVKS